MQEGERVLALFRRHWWFLWPQSILLTLIAVVPVIVAAWVFDAIGVLDDMGIWFWLIVGVIRLFFNWYRYNHDIWVVTNQRIIDSYKRHPFSLRIATADLVNVQDMTVEREGILRTLLDYGDIVCQTAAEAQEFRLAGIPNPREIQALVDRERDRERMRGRSAEL